VNVTVNTAVSQLYFVHADHLNTPRLVANSAQQTVWRWAQQEPFGVSVPDENPSALGPFEFPLRFPGQYYDKETNLHYNHLRDAYDPALGRFTQADPAGTVFFRDVGSLSLGALGLVRPELGALLFTKQPQYNHLYSYVGSAPLTNSDPLGLGPLDCYRCIKCTDEFEEALKKCRREWDECETLKEQIQYIEKYGGGYVSSAILNCATQMNPDAYRCMIRSCGECSWSPWPRRR